jgi:hypothetical protein
MLKKNCTNKYPFFWDAEFFFHSFKAWFLFKKKYKKSKMSRNMQKSYIIRSQTRHTHGKMSLHEIDVYPNHLSLHMYGLSGSYYTIDIQEGQKITCNCRDRMLVESICEHVGFVLQNVFKIEEIPIKAYTVTSQDYQHALNPYDSK